jgi:hypothetical protein
VHRRGKERGRRRLEDWKKPRVLINKEHGRNRETTKETLGETNDE